MARRRKPEVPENHERWLVSYADFITLLFAFFVVMFASSQTDKAKASAVSESVKAALEKGGMPSAVREILGGTVDDKGKGNAMMKGAGGEQKKKDDQLQIVELLPSLKYLNKSLEDEIRTGKLEVRMEARGLVVSLRQASFFPSGADSIDPSTHSAMEKIAGVVKDLPNAVRLEGHTDSVPIHTERFRSNWELSAARAIAMMELLASRFGIRRDRMAIAGYAEIAPLESNDTEAGRAHNRRVDIVVLNQQTMTREPSTIKQAAETSSTPEPAGKPRP